MLYKAIFKVLLAAFLLLWVSNVSAIDAPVEFNALEDNKGNAQLQWGKVDDALMYTIYYGKDSIDIANYSSQTDFIEENTVTLPNIKKGETTFFSVVAIDENGKESEFSKETQITLGATESKFVLEEVLPKSNLEINAIFSQNLETKEDSLREFNIYTKIGKEPIEIKNIEIDEKNNKIATIILESELQEGVEYEITAIAIVNEKWTSIASWIDSLQNFYFIAADIVVEVEEPVLTNTWTVDVELNAADTNKAGSNIESQEIDKQLSQAVKNVDSLPKTWPEVVLLFLLAIILSGLIYMFKFKKN